MMQFNVAQLLKEPIGSTRHYRVEDSLDLLGEGHTSRVEGEANLIRTNRSVMVTAKLKTEVAVTCSRCLSPFRLPLTLSMEEEFFPIIDILTGLPPPPSEEPGAFTIDEHHILDLTEAVRQYTLLAIPMKLLCREDCAGFCATCGQNLNEGACHCSTQEVDPRWAKLAQLALKQKSKRKKGK
ncbi:MAG: DUF177 domain-containing protein [Chloroflexota bacterium]